MLSSIDLTVFKGIFYFFLTFKNACSKNPCKNNATCQAGFTDKDYKCLCLPGFTGHDCDVGKKHCQLLIMAGLLPLSNKSFERLKTDSCTHNSEGPL